MKIYEKFCRILRKLELVLRELSKKAGILFVESEILKDFFNEIFKKVIKIRKKCYETVRKIL